MTQLRTPFLTTLSKKLSGILIKVDDWIQTQILAGSARRVLKTLISVEELPQPVNYKKFMDPILKAERTKRKIELPPGWSLARGSDFVRVTDANKNMFAQVTDLLETDSSKYWPSGPAERDNSSETKKDLES